MSLNIIVGKKYFLQYLKNINYGNGYYLFRFETFCSFLIFFENEQNIQKMNKLCTWDIKMSHYRFKNFKCDILFRFGTF